MPVYELFGGPLRDRVRLYWSHCGTTRARMGTLLGTPPLRTYDDIAALKTNMDYGAIGTVTNLAARLCGEAKGGQILISSRVASAVEDIVDAAEVGALALKGLVKPVPTFNVVGLKPGA